MEEELKIPTDSKRGGYIFDCCVFMFGWECLAVNHPNSM